MVVAVVAPGQGAQKPGFLAPWLDTPDAGATLSWWSTFTGLDLHHLGINADADEIKDTAKTQPLLAAAALLAARQLPLADVTVVAGHSIGELSAAALAGALTPETAIALAAVRGRAMAAACADAPTGMTAILGGNADEVLARLDELGLTPANRNGAGQTVAAGPIEALEKLAANPPAKARLISLQVAGAFHTNAMASAEHALNTIASAATVADPHKLLISNMDGTAIGTGNEVIRRIVAQVTKPVRWDLCQSCFADLGVTALIELPPAGTLAGLAKRALPGIEIVTVNTLDDLAAAADVIARHGGHSTGEPEVQFSLAVATAAGTFAPAELREGEIVPAGSILGQVQTRQGAVPVTASRSGALLEWLAHAGDPVARGQALARLEARS